jgi:hypothetical protein
VVARDVRLSIQIEWAAYLLARSPAAAAPADAAAAAARRDADKEMLQLHMQFNGEMPAPRPVRRRLCALRSVRAARPAPSAVRLWETCVVAPCALLKVRAHAVLKV